MSEKNSKVDRAYLDRLGPRPILRKRVPEWDNREVGILSLGARARANLLARYKLQSDGTLGIEQTADMGLRLLCKALCNGDGTRLFKDDELDVLDNKLDESFDDLVLAAMSHNRLGGEAEKNEAGRAPKPASIKGSQ